MNQFINFNELHNAVVKKEPFPYTMIPNLINPDRLADIVNAFPQISHRGSIPVSSIDCPSLFQEFVKEVEETAFREAIAHKFAIDLSNKPSMTTLRGYTTERDGRIHIDSKDKLITVLIYMNPIWDSEEGNLRILKNNHSLDDYVDEVFPTAGSCLIFKVTDNCWHGHKAFIGKRQSLQFNYLTHDAALKKHLNNHRFSAKLKRWFPWAFGSVNQN